MSPRILLLLAIALPACTVPGGPGLDEAGAGGKADGVATTGGLGARWRADRSAIDVRVYSLRATAIQLEVFAEPFAADAALRVDLAPVSGAPGVWGASVAADALAGAGVSTVYYGYRAWGPNWPVDAGWTPGSTAGFISDVDGQGNRFNPNKLLTDPYALEVSHDPSHGGHTDRGVFASGRDFRHIDSAPFAPKAIVLDGGPVDLGPAPTRPLKDEIIYEVHVRGLTRNDPGVPAELRGTYAGAARKAAYLADLGVTAVELLPVHELQDDQNDLAVGTAGDNYWGYATLSFFAPDRRYAADRSPGGPTREFQEMVRAFHQAGIKVYLDVVYNHTGEGGLWDGTGEVAELLSFRGLDNAAYYELAGGGRFYYDSNGVAGNVNVADPAARDLVIDSLAYWHGAMGVDGFRFDLAAVLGNRCTADCFQFDKLEPGNILNRAVRQLPVRPAAGGAGVDLIAEPWAIGVYQMGNFPSGWAEWNGRFRDTVRADQNLMGVEPVTPGELATRIAGSSDLFGDDGRKPWHSINFLVAHDGFTLRDLYSCNGKHNGQAWPFGPSDGGEDHNRSWDHGGDPAAQRQAARTGLALLMLSAGVPMVTGGDEMLRSQRCNNNAYNLDSEGNWLDWGAAGSEAAFTRFTRGLMRFRAAHPALRPAEFFTGRDRDGNGLADITWLRDDGGRADGGYLDAADRHFLAWRIDGGELGDSAASIYVAYNGWSGQVTASLPPPRPGRSWYRVADTAAWMEGMSNIEDTADQDRMDGASYQLAGRSLLLLVER